MGGAGVGFGFETLVVADLVGEELVVLLEADPLNLGVSTGANGSFLPIGICNLLGTEGPYTGPCAL